MRHDDFGGHIQSFAIGSVLLSLSTDLASLSLSVSRWTGAEGIRKCVRNRFVQTRTLGGGDRHLSSEPLKSDSLEREPFIHRKNEWQRGHLDPMV